MPPDPPDADADWYVAEIAANDTGEMGALFRGEWHGKYPSQSEADLALVKMLLRLTDSNRECWSAFRMSALGKREKAARQDYMRSTLIRARAHLANDAAQIAHGQQIVNALITGTRVQNPRHFRLLHDDDLRHLAPQRWLVKGIIPDGSIGTIFGQSGTFKSFLTLDLMAHVSNGQPWFGKRVIAAPAVYVPFEGKGGIPKRVAAWRLAKMHRGFDVTTNMRFITEPMNLRNSLDRDKLVATLTESGWAGGILCIDTLAQAGVGIDENSSEGMGEMIAVFQELQRRLGGGVQIQLHFLRRDWRGAQIATDELLRGEKRQMHLGMLRALPWMLTPQQVSQSQSGQTFPWPALCSSSSPEILLRSLVIKLLHPTCRIMCVCGNQLRRQPPMKDGGILEQAKADMERARREVQELRRRHNAAVDEYKRRRARFERLEAVRMDHELSLRENGRRRRAPASCTTSGVVIAAPVAPRFPSARKKPRPQAPGLPLGRDSISRWEWSASTRQLS